MSEEPRFCPICGETMQEAVCPADGVKSLRQDAAGLSANDPLIGKVFGDRYRIDALLGEGGFGRVYSATQMSTGRAVALRVLHSKLNSDKRQLRRFYRETKAASRVNSPHVVRVHGFGVHEILTGGPPFAAPETMAVVTAQVTKPPPPLPDPLPCGDPVPPALVHLHQALLAKSRNARPQSPEMVVRILDAVARKEVVDAGALLSAPGSGELPGREVGGPGAHAFACDEDEVQR